MKISYSTFLTQGFKTSKGEIIKGSRLIEALNKVANDWKEKALFARRKEKDLSEVLELAESIRRGEQMVSWCWKRINTELTGEYVAFQPEYLKVF